jgi:hypothetical protein
MADFAGSVTETIYPLDREGSGGMRVRRTGGYGGGWSSREVRGPRAVSAEGRLAVGRRCAMGVQ